MPSNITLAFFGISMSASIQMDTKGSPRELTSLNLGLVGRKAAITSSLKLKQTSNSAVVRMNTAFRARGRLSHENAVLSQEKAS